MAGIPDDRVAIVTGAAHGIGRGIAHRFAREGMSVVLADRDVEGAERAAAEISGAGGEAIAVDVNIADTQQVGRMLATTIECYKRIDILVNNAAISLLYEPFFEISEESWRQMIGVNLTGMFWCSQGAAVHMRDAGRGWIINIASVNSFRPELNATHYAAAKGGVVNLTKGMALELAPYGISVNGIAPGATRTERTDDFDHDSANRDIVQRALGNIPLHRRATPDEIASVAVFLASDGASYIRGEIIVVDGGFLLT